MILKCDYFDQNNLNDKCMFSVFLENFFINYLNLNYKIINFV